MKRRIGPLAILLLALGLIYGQHCLALSQLTDSPSPADGIESTIESSDQSSTGAAAEQHLRRSKRTLTTICVQITPSSPRDVPYYMCKDANVVPAAFQDGSNGNAQFDKQSPAAGFTPGFKEATTPSYAQGDNRGYITDSGDNIQFQSHTKSTGAPGQFNFQGSSAEQGGQSQFGQADRYQSTPASEFFRGSEQTTPAAYAFNQPSAFNAQTESPIRNQQQQQQKQQQQAYQQSQQTGFQQSANGASYAATAKSPSQKPAQSSATQSAAAPTGNKSGPNQQSARPTSTASNGQSQSNPPAGRPSFAAFPSASGVQKPASTKPAAYQPASAAFASQSPAAARPLPESAANTQVVPAARPTAPATPTATTDVESSWPTFGFQSGNGFFQPPQQPSTANWPPQSVSQLYRLPADDSLTNPMPNIPPELLNNGRSLLPFAQGANIPAELLNSGDNIPAELLNNGGAAPVMPLDWNVASQAPDNMGSAGNSAFMSADDVLDSNPPTSMDQQNFQPRLPAAYMNDPIVRKFYASLAETPPPPAEPIENLLGASFDAPPSAQSNSGSFSPSPNYAMAQYQPPSSIPSVTPPRVQGQPGPAVEPVYLPQRQPQTRPAPTPSYQPSQQPARVEQFPTVSDAGSALAPAGPFEQRCTYCQSPTPREYNFQPVFIALPCYGQDLQNTGFTRGPNSYMSNIASVANTATRMLPGAQVAFNNLQSNPGNQRSFSPFPGFIAEPMAVPQFQNMLDVPEPMLGAPNPNSQPDGQQQNPCDPVLGMTGPGLFGFGFKSPFGGLGGFANPFGGGLFGGGLLGSPQRMFASPASLAQAQDQAQAQAQAQTIAPTLPMSRKQLLSSNAASASASTKSTPMPKIVAATTNSQSAERVGSALEEDSEEASDEYEVQSSSTTVQPTTTSQDATPTPSINGTTIPPPTTAVDAKSTNSSASPTNAETADVLAQPRSFDETPPNLEPGSKAAFKSLISAAKQLSNIAQNDYPGEPNPPSKRSFQQREYVGKDRLSGFSGESGSVADTKIGSALNTGFRRRYLQNL